MNRCQRVAQLIAQRKSIAEVTDHAARSLHNLHHELQRLDNLRDEIAGRLPAGSVRDRLEGFSFQAQAGDAQRLAAALEQAAKRFHRGRLQIGLLGRAGQGKSTLLRRLTGLGEDAIPSGKRGHCTGARSVIANDPTTTSPHARLHFADEPTFLRDAVLPYFTFFGEKLPAPCSLDDFARTDLHGPELEQLAQAGGDLKAKLTHLRRLQEELLDYRPLLCGSTRDIPGSEIRRYVAQDDSSGRRLSTYQALDYAEVFCHFPREDLGDIAFLDMPGLGDTGLGQEERLIRLMAEEADLVLLVRLPQDNRDSWMDFDVNLYQVAHAALRDLLPIERWMLLVLNRRASPDNSHNCEAMDQGRQHSGILVAQSLTADCDDPAQVINRVLDPALDFLETHLSELDQRYLANMNKEVQAFREELARRCASARQLVPLLRPGDSPGLELWRHLHRDFARQLRVQLGQFVDHLRLQRREPDARLKEALELVLEPLSERADTSLVPPPDELQRLSYVEGGWPGALQEAMNRIRSELTHRLLGLDAPLRETFGEAKEGLRQAIVVPGLRLGEPFIGDNAWQNLAQRAQEADCPELAKGFGFVANFALTYFGFIHHRIREALDPLTPDARPLPPISTGPDAHEFLWDAVEHAVFQMRKQLAGLLAEPTMARFAMAEEFKDQAVRREGVDDEWERFTSAYRDVLWPGSFLQAEGEAALYKRWTEAVQQVERVAATVAALGGQPA